MIWAPAHLDELGAAGVGHEPRAQRGRQRAQQLLKVVAVDLDGAGRRRRRAWGGRSGARGCDRCWRGGSRGAMLMLRFARARSARRCQQRGSARQGTRAPLRSPAPGGEAVLTRPTTLAGAVARQATGGRGGVSRSFGAARVVQIEARARVPTAGRPFRERCKAMAWGAGPRGSAISRHGCACCQPHGAGSRGGPKQQGSGLVKAHTEGGGEPGRQQGRKPRGSRGSVDRGRGPACSPLPCPPWNNNHQ